MSMFQKWKKCVIMVCETCLNKLNKIRNVKCPMCRDILNPSKLDITQIDITQCDLEDLEDFDFNQLTRIQYKQLFVRNYQRMLPGFLALRYPTE